MGLHRKAKVSGGHSAPVVRDPEELPTTLFDRDTSSGGRIRIRESAMVNIKRPNSGAFGRPRSNSQAEYSSSLMFIKTNLRRISMADSDALSFKEPSL
jgi:hypothetical protein